MRRREAGGARHRTSSSPCCAGTAAARCWPTPCSRGVAPWRRGSSTTSPTSSPAGTTSPPPTGDGPAAAGAGRARTAAGRRRRHRWPTRLVDGLTSGTFRWSHRAVLLNVVARMDAAVAADGHRRPAPRPDRPRRGRPTTSPRWRCGRRSSSSPRSRVEMLAELRAAPRRGRREQVHRAAAPRRGGLRRRARRPRGRRSTATGRRSGSCRRGPSSPICWVAASTTAPRSPPSTSASAASSRSPWPRWRPIGRCCCSACRARRRRG